MSQIKGTPEDHLLLTERGTGKVREIPLEKLRKGFVTLGRREATETHYQLAADSAVQPWVSGCHATLYAKPRKGDSTQWDYYLRDGCRGTSEWKNSAHGVWAGGERFAPDYEFQLRPGFGGYITLFPKIHDFSYEAILEWPVREQPAPDSSQPTLQQYQRLVVEKDNALMQKRAALEQAELNRQKLQSMGSQLISIQQDYDQKIGKQSTRLFELSGKLEEERTQSQQTKIEIAKERAINRAQDKKISWITRFSIAAAIAVLTNTQVDEEKVSAVLDLIAILGVGGSVGSAIIKSEGSHEPG